MRAQLHAYAVKHCSCMRASCCNFVQKSRDGLLYFRYSAAHMNTSTQLIWHAKPAQEALSALETSRDTGLSTTNVADRQRQYGSNVIRSGKPTYWYQRVWAQINQPLIYILIVAGCIKLGIREWTDAGVILTVVAINIVVGYVQDMKASSAIAALKGMMTATVLVRRNGTNMQVSSLDLVPGDIVLLRAGDKVSADARLLDVQSLRIDESSLTGESVPVEKRTAPVAEETTLADRHNMVYCGTLATNGAAEAVIVATGMQTELGKISSLIAEAEEVATPLTKKLESFSHMQMFVILSLAFVTFVVGLLRGQQLTDMIKAAVALSVAMIPEGLPTVVTVTLAFGVTRMARRNALIRRMPAVETLGSTTVICSDKTGTLTRNQMTVKRVWSGGKLFTVDGDGYACQGAITPPAGTGDAGRGLIETLRCGLLCNDASLGGKEDGSAVTGDPTEVAMLVAAGKARLLQQAETKRLPQLAVLPFDSDTQYMVTLHKQDEAAAALYIKGSLEALLPRCTLMIDANGQQVAMDAAHVRSICERLASEGMRVIVCAARFGMPHAKQISPNDLSDLVFLGMQAMIDPPRAEAIDAVHACHSAGIRVAMITGDHPLTAAAIAGRIGLRGKEADGKLLAVTGAEMAAMDDAALTDVAAKYAVFARVMPEQKLRLVKALQGLGHVVAMTGDGVNDAPAIKRADIGVAMGKGGTEVAKEAAALVLADDNFASIRAAVEEGRTVFDNIKKFIVWALPTNLGEGMVIMVGILAGLRLPILPLQILWINMMTSLFLGLALAFEPKEDDIMQRPPRNPKAPLIDRTLIYRIGLVAFVMLISAFGIFELLLHSGATVETARTGAVSVFIFIELLYLFHCRSLTHSAFSVGLHKNMWVWIGTPIMIALQLLFVYAPPFQFVFESAPLSLLDWAWVVLAAVVAYIVVDIQKRLALRRAQSKV